MVRDGGGEWTTPVGRFGRYEAVRRLGRGAMGEVLEGRHVDLGTRVALKVLHGDAAGDPGALRRVVREGRALAAIRHPHVVTVLDVGVEGGRPFLVMELLEGEDLAKKLAREGPLPTAEAADCLVAVASAIAAAHVAAVVHRDLKPSNVFLARRPGGVEPVVVDFGISKLPPSEGDVATSAHAIAGTPLYMAPEQLRGFEATYKSDQYALGVVLYESVTGSAPFFHEGHYELLHAIMTAPIVAPSVLNPQVPCALDAVILRALARDPAARFPSVQAFGCALLSFASESARHKWVAVPDLPRDSGHSLAATAESVVRAPARPKLARWAWGALCALLAAGTLCAYVAATRARAVAGTPGPAASRDQASPPAAPVAERLAAPITRIAVPAPSSAPGGRPAPTAQTTKPILVRPVRAAVAPQASSLLPVGPAPAVETPIERGTRDIPIVE